MIESSPNVSADEQSRASLDDISMPCEPGMPRDDAPVVGRDEAREEAVVPREQEDEVDGRPSRE